MASGHALHQSVHWSNIVRHGWMLWSADIPVDAAHIRRPHLLRKNLGHAKLIILPLSPLVGLDQDYTTCRWKFSLTIASSHTYAYHGSTTTLHSISQWQHQSFRRVICYRVVFAPPCTSTPWPSHNTYCFTRPDKAAWRENWPNSSETSRSQEDHLTLRLCLCLYINFSSNIHPIHKHMRARHWIALPCTRINNDTCGFWGNYWLLL